jgi:uncharacterized protein YjbI with pentapeptide repeats
MLTDEQAAARPASAAPVRGPQSTRPRAGSASRRAGVGFSGRQGLVTILCLGCLADWGLALAVNPTARMFIRKSALWPIVQVETGWAVFLLAWPALAIAALIAVRLSAPSGAQSTLRRFVVPACRALGPVLLLLNFLKALKLHLPGLAYAGGAFLVAGTAAAWFPARRSGGERRRPRLLRPWLRWTGLALGLGLEAFGVIQAVPWTGRGFYQGSFKPGLLRPLLQPWLSLNLSGRDLSARMRAGARSPSYAHARLQGARLVEAQARGLDFWMARLQTAALGGADISRSDFSRATLNEVEFYFARAAAADFSWTTFFGTRSVGTDFRGASFRSARLDFAKFVAVDGRNSDWSGANFFKGGQIFGSNLEGADFRGARLAGSDLRKSDFSGVDFRGADLRGALVWHSVFRGANLEGADLRDTDAEPDQLGAARTLFRARLDPALHEAIEDKYPALLEGPAISSSAAPGPRR